MLNKLVSWINIKVAGGHKGKLARPDVTGLKLMSESVKIV